MRILVFSALFIVGALASAAAVALSVALGYYASDGISQVAFVAVHNGFGAGLLGTVGPPVAAMILRHATGLQTAVRYLIAGYFCSAFCLVWFMQQTGAFSESVLGGHAALAQISITLGSITGGSIAAAIWLHENETTRRWLGLDDGRKQ